MDNDRDQHPTSISANAMVVFYYECTNMSIACDIGQLTLSRTPVAELLLRTESMERHPALSPNQRWQISTTGGNRPLWSPDGRTLYYAQGERTHRQMMAVSIDDKEALTAGVPQPLFESRSGFLAPIVRNHDLHPDGKRFLMAVPADAAGARMICVQNWLDEVTQLMQAARSAQNGSVGRQSPGFDKAALTRLSVSD